MDNAKLKERRSTLQDDLTKEKACFQKDKESSKIQHANDIREKLETISDLENRLSNVNKHFAAQTDDLEKLRDKHSKEVNKLKSKIGQLEESNAEMNTGKAELVEELKAKDGEIVKLQREGRDYIQKLLRRRRKSNV